MARPTVTLKNPLHDSDIQDDLNNNLYTIELDDIVVGCVRAFDTTSKQVFVNPRKVINLLKTLEEFSTVIIMDALNCSKAQASRYMQVLTLSAPFLERWIKSGAKVRGYIEITPEQAARGILPQFVKSTKGEIVQ